VTKEVVERRGRRCKRRHVLIELVGVNQQPGTVGVA
jgi:hypothetical protein